MLVKDEEDIIEYTIRHLLWHVDEVIVADNMSTDGTRNIIQGLADETRRVDVRDDLEVGYYQSEKTTALALEAYAAGFDWVIPCDADEIWYAPDKQRIGDYLKGVPADVQIVTASLDHHIPTAADNDDPNPIRRIGWRMVEPSALPKVACRLHPRLEIHMGNHTASAPGLITGGLCIRHFSFRSVGQYIRKLRNGESAYAAAPEKAAYGEHWREFAGKPDEAIADYFHTWFWSDDPSSDSALTYDPSPYAGEL